MSRISIDGLSDGLLQRLQTRASAKGHSLEETALDILKGALPGSDEVAPHYPGSAEEAYRMMREIYGAAGWRDLEPEDEIRLRCSCDCHRLKEQR